MTIFLVRHGETVCNATRVVQPPEAELSALGIEQAERLARRLAAEGVRAVRTSDLARARETARRVALACGAAVVEDPGLQERNYGAIRGTPYAALDCDIFAPDYDPPGGEPWGVFHARVDDAWARAVQHAAQGTGPLAVVTHGLVCYSILARGLVEAAGWRTTIHFGNASVTVIEGPPWRARIVDATDHLRAPAASPSGAV